jgi:sensor histidine kinase regulating citrate/malate metabolism
MEAERMAFDRQKLLILVMAIALIITVGYTAMDFFQTIQIEEQNSIFTQGAQFGYQQAVIQLLQQASTCQAVPVTANNVTLNLIAVECLQQTPTTQ